MLCVRCHSGHRPGVWVFAATAALVGATADRSTSAAVLLDDQFTDGERATQALPSSAQWTIGAHNATAANAYGTLTASSGELVLDHTNAGNNSFAGTWAYFTPSGSPVSLAVNDRLTLRFDVRFPGGFSTTAGAFRWALFNSGGNRVTTDFVGTNESGLSSGTTFSGWRGYEAQTPVSTSGINAAGSADFVTRERTGSGPGLFTSSNWAALSGSGAEEATFVANQTYPASLVLTRTATGVTVQGSINGVSTAAVTDTASPFTSFDTAAFFTLESLTSDIVLDNVRVETDVVPEPGSTAAAAVAALGLLAARRRRTGRVPRD